jgi:hypothetical protein
VVPFHAHIFILLTATKFLDSSNLVNITFYFNVLLSTYGDDIDR